MSKEPKDEDDPTGLRWFAKRIGEMRWWRENSKPEEPEELPAQPVDSEESGETSDDRQPPTQDDPGR